MIIIRDNFAYFFIKRLDEAILMSTHNIGFNEEISKIISEFRGSARP